MGRRRTAAPHPPGARRFALLTVAPAVAILVAITVVPLVRSLQLSFQRNSLLSTEAPRYVGLHNYATLMHDSLFWSSLKVTLLFAALVIVVQLPVGILIALAIDRLRRGGQLVATLILIPSIISPSVVSFQWKQLFDYNTGVLNFLLTHLGLPAQGWTASPGLALPSLLLVDFWEWTPFVVLLTFAGLRSLPQPVLEAAEVDGSRGWQVVLYQKLPMLRRVIVITLVLRLLNAFKVFDTIYVLTAGGPGIRTESLTFYNYVQAFRYFNIGYSSAMSFVGLVIVAVLVRIILATSGESRRPPMAAEPPAVAGGEVHP